MKPFAFLPLIVATVAALTLATALSLIFRAPRPVLTEQRSIADAPVKVMRRSLLLKPADFGFTATRGQWKTFPSFVPPPSPPAASPSKPPF
jgi:hypothetical protein